MNKSQPEDLKISFTNTQCQKCERCEGWGHKSIKCPAERDINGSVSRKVQCYSCSGFGHYSSKCPNEGSLKEGPSNKETISIRVKRKHIETSMTTI